MKRTFAATLFNQSALFILALCFFAGPVHAINSNHAQPLLKDIHLIQTHSYRAVNAYYNFSLNPGDKVLQAEITEEIAAVDATLKALKSRPGIADINPDVNTISNTWKKCRNLINTNIKNVIDQGYAENRLVLDMAQTSIDLGDILREGYKNILAQSDFTPGDSLSLSREAVLLISQMMTQYSARHASALNQSFLAVTTNDPIDIMAIHFDENLKKLRNDKNNSSEINELLKKITSTWGFIKKSYINYTENNVSYVVNLYSSKILTQLQKYSSINESRRG